MVIFFKQMDQKQSRSENNKICCCSVWVCIFLQVDSLNLQDSRDQQEGAANNLFRAADTNTVYTALCIFVNLTL